jgi:hypothetical protein
VSRTFYALVILVIEYVLFLKITTTLYLAEFPAPATPVEYTPKDQFSVPEEVDVLADMATALEEPSLALDPC